jgi:hypothetical protein
MMSEEETEDLKFARIDSLSKWHWRNMMSEVWLFEAGQDYEGGSVLGVFSTKELAMSALEEKRTILLERFEGCDWAKQVSEIEGGTFHCGCDWFSIDRYTIDKVSEFR